MKQFADLHLQPNLDDRDLLEKTIQKAADLGYTVLGVSVPYRVREGTIDFLQKICIDNGVDFVKRIDLTPRSSKDLLRSLRLFRRKFELVAVSCFSKSIARQAAKDHRVDLLVFSSDDSRGRFFDVAEARLASQGVAAFEVDMALLLKCGGFSRVRLLSCLRREIGIAGKFGVSVVICSGAVDAFGLRGPRDFVSLAALFGMTDVAALNAVSVAPLAIVERNRRKLDSNYVAKGVRVIRRGRNCDD